MNEELVWHTEIDPQWTVRLRRRGDAVRERISAASSSPGSRPLKVAVYQMRNHCDGLAGKDANLHKIMRVMRESAGAGAGLLACPEMCLPGYFSDPSGSVEDAVRENHALADVVGSSSYLDALQTTAMDCGVALFFGFCERVDDAYYNSIGVIDRDGRWLGTRRKNPLYPWPYDTQCFREPDPSLRSTVFPCSFGAVGVCDCFDGEFPETVRRMRLDGAEMLVWCNAACGDPTLGTSHRVHHAGGHAQANGFFVVCVNCVAPNATGTSVIMSHTGDPLVILSPDQEECGMASIDLSMSSNWDLWRTRLA